MRVLVWRDLPVLRAEARLAVCKGHRSDIEVVPEIKPLLTLLAILLLVPALPGAKLGHAELARPFADAMITQGTDRWGASTAHNAIQCCCGRVHLTSCLTRYSRSNLAA